MLAYLTKHHGIVVDMPGETQFWSFEYNSDGYFRKCGNCTCGTRQKYLGEYTGKQILNAYNGALRGRSYSARVHNCNHFVERMRKGLGLDLDIGCFSS